MKTIRESDSMISKETNDEYYEKSVIYSINKEEEYFPIEESLPPHY